MSIVNGKVQVHIATVVPSKMVALAKLEAACAEYKVKPFSLDRRSVAAKNFGTKPIAIMRKFSERYPEFLEDKFFAFSWIDVQKAKGAQPTDTGVMFTENSNGMIDAEALATFIQIMFQVFDMDDMTFVCPVYMIQVRGGWTSVTDAICVQRTVIRRREVLKWAKSISSHFYEKRGLA